MLKDTECFGTNDNLIDAIDVLIGNGGYALVELYESKVSGVSKKYLKKIRSVSIQFMLLLAFRRS